MAPLIIAVDGLIGAGKTTFLSHLATAIPDADIIMEPVGEWMRLKDDVTGKSLLELFYEDKKRWAYTFQNCVILTRLRVILDAIRSTKKKILITERSVLTDRYVFAEMLREDGTLSSIEWDLYCSWFDTFAKQIQIGGIIYLTTSVGTSAGRIIGRGRAGEEHIPLEYLSALDAQHRKWLDSSAINIPVLKISTELDVSVGDNISAVRKFIDSLELSNKN